jgi:hypothetical protein
MKPIGLVSLMLLGAVLCGMAAVAGENAPIYSQNYAILIKESVAGSEKVTETMDGARNIVSASDHEIFVTDGLGTKRMAFTTRMLLAKNTYAPMSYFYKYTAGDAGDSYDVTVKNAQIKRVLTRSGHASEVTVPLQANTVILDFNVYHQYDYLVRRYDGSKGGRQIFNDFVPLIGTDIPLAVTFLGDGELKLENGSIPVSNYKIEFVGIAQGTLSVDKNKRLVHLLIPTQDLEVVRNDLLPGNLTN